MSSPTPNKAEPIAAPLRVSLTTRIFLGYSAVLITFGAVSLFGVSAMHENQFELGLISQGYLPLSQDIAALEALHGHQRRDTDRLVDEKNTETRRALIRLARLYTPAALVQRAAVARDTARKLERHVTQARREDRAALRELVTKLDVLEERTRRLSAALERIYQVFHPPSPDPAQAAEALVEIRVADDAMVRELRTFRAGLDSQIREVARDAERRERKTGVAIILLSVFAIGVGLLVTLFSARTLAPVRTLTEAVAQVARGDFSTQLGLTGEDEISRLGRGFDAMAGALRERDAQLQEKQVALLRAEQLAAVGRVSAQIAHEVRNPLSSIGLNVELLQDAVARARFDRPEEGQEARALLASVLREVDRVTEVTEGYLGMARLPQPALAAEDVNAVLGSILDFSGEELVRSGVEVVRELDPAAPRALADERQLRQVFLNLVRNSREAMQNGGRLTVRSRAHNGCVEVEFVDSGPGIEPAARKRMFQPFFSTKKNGTGLGLAVSRQILEAHGATIRCDSAPGRGTTFTLSLPRA